MRILSEASPLDPTYLNLLRVKLAKCMFEKLVSDEYCSYLNSDQMSAVTVYLAALDHLTSESTDKSKLCYTLLARMHSIYAEAVAVAGACATESEHDQDIAGINMLFLIDISNAIGFLSLFEHVQEFLLKSTSITVHGKYFKAAFLAEYFFTIFMNVENQMPLQLNINSLEPTSVLERCLLDITNYRLRRLLGCKQSSVNHGLLKSKTDSRNVFLSNYSLDLIIHNYHSQLCTVQSQ